MKLTKQRVHLFSILAPGSHLTLGNILHELGKGEQISRNEYIRVHQFVWGLVQQGLIGHEKKSRHGESKFYLTPRGTEVASSLLHAYEEKVRKILSWGPAPPGTFRVFPLRTPALPALTEKTPPRAVEEKPIPPIRCPNCGAVTTGAEAQAMFRKGQKVRCQCNYNLTPLAWTAIEGR